MTDTGSEYGRLLAERDRLITEGADPAELEMPLRPRGARSMTTEPRTEAGRRLVAEYLSPDPEDIDTPGWLESQVLAIETEAARLALEDVAERVRHLKEADHRPLAQDCYAAVLSLLSTKEEGS